MPGLLDQIKKDGKTFLQFKPEVISELIKSMRKLKLKKDTSA